jgi:hypothetical protein
MSRLILALLLLGPPPSIGEHQPPPPRLHYCLGDPTQGAVRVLYLLTQCTDTDMELDISPRVDR